MKNASYGFVGIFVVVVIAALAVGGGMYYSHTLKERNIRTEDAAIVQTEEDVPTQISKTNIETKVVVPARKSAAQLLEEKARALAIKSECMTRGSIGAVESLELEYEYVMFSINDPEKTGYYSCVVDVYAIETKGSVYAFGKPSIISSAPVCSGDGECFGTGALPTPLKQYESIPVAKFEEE